MRSQRNMGRPPASTARAAARGGAGVNRPMSGRVAAQAVLLLNAFLVLAPMVIMGLSAFKSTREIFQNPFGLPGVWRWENFARVWVEAKFALYFRNSILV